MATRGKMDGVCNLSHALLWVPSLSILESVSRTLAQRWASESSLEVHSWHILWIHKPQVAGQLHCIHDSGMQEKILTEENEDVQRGHMRQSWLGCELGDGQPLKAHDETARRA